MKFCLDVGIYGILCYLQQIWNLEMKQALYFFCWKLTSTVLYMYVYLNTDFPFCIHFFFKIFHKCESMPTLLEYSGVCQTQAESPGLLYRSPNLLDMKESSLIKYSLFYMYFKWLIFWYFKGKCFECLLVFVGWIGKISLATRFFLAWLRR